MDKAQAQKKQSAGFTLVETLVAISILSLSILGTFTAVQHSLQTSGFAKDQITAFYLVQEGMEYVRNMRDQNALASIASVNNGGGPVNWLTGLSASAPDPCYFGKTCRIDSPNATLATCSGGWGSCPNLLQDPTSGLFGYTGGWTDSRFRREMQITQVSANEVKVTISIAWTSANFSKNFQVTESLFNWH